MTSTADRSIASPLDIAFHTIHYSPRFGATVALADVLEAAAGAGFRHVGLDRASIAGQDGRGGRDAAAALYDRFGLRCSDIIALALTGDEQLDVALAREIAADAAATGASRCVVALALPLGWDVLRRVASTCAGVLDEAGVRLAVEYGSYFGVRSLAEARRLCAEVGWERAGVAVDSWQFARARTPWAELEALDAGQLALVQYADVLAEPDEDVVTESRHRRLIPGAGAFDRARFVRTVLGTGYRGPVVAEILSADARATDPSTFAAAVAEAMRRDWTPRIGDMSP